MSGHLEQVRVTTLALTSIEMDHLLKIIFFYWGSFTTIKKLSRFAK